MLYTSDFNQLLNNWNAQLNSKSVDPAYKDALRDCIYDLNSLLTKSIDEELTYQDFLEMEADSYLSSLEAHEPAA